MTTVRTSPRRRATAVLWPAMTLALTVAACGSSGGNGAAPTVPSTTPPTVPAPTSTTGATTTTEALETNLSVEDGTADIIGIVGAFNSGDLSSIDTLLGADGMWVGISGQQWPGPTATEHLRPLLAGITSTEILGEGTLVEGGWAFPLREHKGATTDYAIVVGRDGNGAAVVTEQWKVPEPLRTPAACDAPSPGTHDMSINVGGRDQVVRVFVPSSVGETVLPAVIDWHATGETAEIQAATSGYEELAEKEGFVVAHPEFSALAYDNFDPGALDADTDRDDIEFAGALMDELIAHWCADPTRIYSTGYSLGSLFTARLACVLSDRLAAVVSVAGVFHSDDCDPARAVPYMAFHGTLDAVLPYDASVKARFGGNRDFLAQEPAAEFAEFAVAAGCSETAVDTPLGSEVIRHDFTGCDDGTNRTFFEIVGGGHTWPGSGEADRWKAKGLGATTDQIDATEVSWDFFEHHHLP